MRLINALYGIIKAALLYYNQFVKYLKSIGFDLNWYDPYFANKMVRGKHITALCPLDDLKVSHRETSVVTKMSEWLKNICKCF